MNRPARFSPEGEVPFLNIEGTAYECGLQLGIAWYHALRENAALARDWWTPWWWKGRGGKAADLVEKIAPHLVDIYRGMAEGAGIDESVCGYARIAAPREACTSFGVHKDLTTDGAAISGQTKDTSLGRTYFYQVLRLKPKDAPGFLTLTYPGELLGHGFAETGMSLFRNTLYVTPTQRGGALSFDAFGLLTLLARDLDSAIAMTRSHGVRLVAHAAVADASGRTVGFELCQGDLEIIEARDGLYAHANHAVGASFRPRETESDRVNHQAGASEHRQQRLYELMEPDRGRLTPQLMLRNLSDHANYPQSICCHRERDYHTTACVIAEPTRGLLHVTRGAPCQNWPTTYRL